MAGEKDTKSNIYVLFPKGNGLNVGHDIDFNVKSDYQFSLSDELQNAMLKLAVSMQFPNLLANDLISERNKIILEYGNLQNLLLLNELYESRRRERASGRLSFAYTNDIHNLEEKITQDYNSQHGTNYTIDQILGNEYNNAGLNYDQIKNNITQRISGLENQYQSLNGELYESIDNLSKENNSFGKILNDLYAHSEIDNLRLKTLDALYNFDINAFSTLMQNAKSDEQVAKVLNSFDRTGALRSIIDRRNGNGYYDLYVKPSLNLQRNITLAKNNLDYAFNISGESQNGNANDLTLNQIDYSKRDAIHDYSIEANKSARDQAFKSVFLSRYGTDSKEYFDLNGYNLESTKNLIDYVLNLAPKITENKFEKDESASWLGDKYDQLKYNIKENWWPELLNKAYKSDGLAHNFASAMYLLLLPSNVLIGNYRLSKGDLAKFYGDLYLMAITGGITGAKNVGSTINLTKNAYNAGNNISFARKVGNFGKSLGQAGGTLLNYGWNKYRFLGNAAASLSNSAKVGNAIKNAGVLANNLDHIMVGYDLLRGAKRSFDNALKDFELKEYGNFLKNAGLGAILTFFGLSAANDVGRFTKFTDNLPTVKFNYSNLFNNSNTINSLKGLPTNETLPSNLNLKYIPEDWYKFFETAEEVK